MDARIAPLAEMLRLNTRLFQNCLAGLADDTARTRPTDITNSAAFVAAHLASSRYYLLSVLGVDQPSPLKGADDGFNDISKVSAFPSLAEIRKAWDAAGETLEQRLGVLTSAQLDAPTDPGFPLVSQNQLGIIVFMVQHEGYHLGQLGLLRKHAGLPAMAYD